MASHAPKVRGTGQEEPAAHVPAPVPLPGRAVAIAAGICHSAAQLESGAVLLWGCSMNGQTGVLRDATAVTVVDLAALEHRRSAATPPMKLFYFAEPPGLVALRHLAC